MCTLTVYRQPDGYVATMNRDERRERGELPPEARTLNSELMCYPSDTQAGGTWFGCNASGVTAALLNSYQNQRQAGVKSRGALIPEVLSLGDFSNIDAFLRKADFTAFDAFHLVVVGRGCLIHLHWNGESAEFRTIHNQGWFFLTSSSIDFPQVQDYRRGYFDEWARTGAPEFVIQDIHLWQTDNKSYSILMEREFSHSKNVCQVKFPFNSPYVDYLPLNSGL